MSVMRGFGTLVMRTNVILSIVLLAYGPTYLKAHDNIVRKPLLALHALVEASGGERKADLALIHGMSRRAQRHANWLFWFMGFWLVANSVIIVWQRRQVWDAP